MPKTIKKFAELMMLAVLASTTLLPPALARETIDEAGLTFNLNDFNFVDQQGKPLKLPPGYRIRLVPGSIEWQDTINSHLIPRANIDLVAPLSARSPMVRSGEETIHFEKSAKDFRAQFKVPLHDDREWEILQSDQIVATFKLKKVQIGEGQVLLDHHCLPFQVKIDGEFPSFLSTVCRYETITKYEGQLGVFFHGGASKEVGRIFLRNQTKTPFSLKINEVDHHLAISARVPREVTPFKLALGFGPYRFLVKHEDKPISDTIAPSYMIYGKYDLSRQTSLRFFDALITNGSLFNNAGLYFAYELASSWRDRVTIVSLLGLQEVSYRYRENGRLFHQAIFPQGGEIVFRHFLGWHNYHLIYGMFLSTSPDVTYENIWLRFGKGIFWELNWLHWKNQERSAKMYGISVGIPLLKM